MTADQYSAYHSIHDNFHLISTWVDPKFKYHLAVARMWVKIGLKLADEVILPFNLHRYAKKIVEFAKFFKRVNAEITGPHGINYGKAASTDRNFLNISSMIFCKSFMLTLESSSK